MTHISDADLMAYADGVLPRHLRPLVRQALLRDPALLEKLECYIITNRGLAAPFDRLPPIPDRLLRLLAEGQPKAAGERWWLFSLRSIEPKWAEQWRLPAWSLAGLAALVAATLLAWQLNTASPLRPQLADAGAQGLASSAQFQRALEASESNLSTHLASVKPTGTFLSKEQAWCRQYEVTRADDTRLAGIACRDHHGAWQVKAQAVLAAAAQTSGYAPAGEGKAGAHGLESALGKLMQDVVLLPADEKRVLAGGWQPPR